MLDQQPCILIIDTNPARAAIIEDGLRTEGYSRVHIITDINVIAAKIVEIEPDAIIIDLGNPSRDMLENMLQIARAVKKPIAMFVDQSDKHSMEQAIEAGVSAYVIDGFRADRVRAIMEMAISRFNAFSRLEKELESAKSALTNRKTIDQAKRILMGHRNLSEEEAYCYLRQTAMNQNRKMIEVAESLILSAELLDFKGGGS